MSQENVEIVRRVYDAAARHDAATVMALYDPEVEWDNSTGLGGITGGGVYRGHEGLRPSFASGARHGSTPSTSLRSCSTRATT
jgi:ketosteroid isomerase-like protein